MGHRILPFLSFSTRDLHTFSFQKLSEKAKSRFGFLSSAKSFVKSVWNHGAGASAATATSNANANSKTGPSAPTTGSSTQNQTRAVAPSLSKPSKPPVPDAKKPVIPRQTSFMARKVSGKTGTDGGGEGGDYRSPCSSASG